MHPNEIEFILSPDSRGGCSVRLRPHYLLYWTEQRWHAEAGTHLVYMQVKKTYDSERIPIETKA
jgi:hypothetical protein